ncbi:MAG: succinylglutamate desuccinylase/aspartoacylase family protein [bacterium]|nr:succinylglutamate desuccinylase/aspartoacylase family protein [bacterium]
MTRKRHITYLELTNGFREKGYKLQQYGAVTERRIKYSLYKIIINPRYKKTLIITSGFHGEEANGPISLLQIIDEIAKFARKMRVRLIIYPCINPSAFELYKRYNGSNEMKNNYFLHYQLEDGTWVGILQPGEKFVDYIIVDSPAKEVRILKLDILKYRVPKAILDIHQQEGNLDIGDVYAYIYRNRATYKRILKKISRIAEIAKNDEAFTFDKKGKVVVEIDNDGFIVLHDGSITDMFHRLGSKYAVTAETDTRLSLEKVSKINYIWITELVKLVAKMGNK